MLLGVPDKVLAVFATKRARIRAFRHSILVPTSMEPVIQQLGPTPKQIVAGYNSNDWEEFINEWGQSLKPPYIEVHKVSGPNDKGRDVCGYYGPEPVTAKSEWDNYQCKHYNHPLRRTEIWIELGKLCYFTHLGDYSIPKKYRFVSPYDVGPTLHDLLLRPEELREAVINAWAKYCEKQIVEGQLIRLEGPLLTYVENFDFGIIGYVPFVEVIKQHSTTVFWTTRFKYAPPSRPPALVPPEEPEEYEMRYVRQLLDAYGDSDGGSYLAPSDLVSMSTYEKHYRRSRESFYLAETLNRFSRDYFPAGAFNALKRQVYDGVVEVSEGSHANGYERIRACTNFAAQLGLANSDLSPYAEPGDKKGICHHLANEDKLIWVKK